MKCTYSKMSYKFVSGSVNWVPDEGKITRKNTGLDSGSYITILKVGNNSVQYGNLRYRFSKFIKFWISFNIKLDPIK
jgi:hypothetical protein